MCYLKLANCILSNQWKTFFGCPALCITHKPNKCILMVRTGRVTKGKRGNINQHRSELQHSVWSDVSPQGNSCKPGSASVALWQYMCTIITIWRHAALPTKNNQSESLFCHGATINYSVLHRDFSFKTLNMFFNALWCLYGSCFKKVI